MSDRTWCTITIHIPASGWPGYAADHLLGLPHPFDGILPEAALGDALLHKVMGKGGHITLTDSEARAGWPFEIDLDEGTMPIPASLDYDYHVQAKYEIPFQRRFRRAGSERIHASNEAGEILLDCHDIEQAMKVNASLADLLVLTQKPSPTYAVPRRTWTYDE